MSVLTAEQFWETLPHCCGYPKCDGDLVATDHSEECPLHGEKEMTRFEFANAYAADLTQRLEAKDALIASAEAKGRLTAARWLSYIGGCSDETLLEILSGDISAANVDADVDVDMQRIADLEKSVDKNGEADGNMS